MLMGGREVTHVTGTNTSNNYNSKALAPSSEKQRASQRSAPVHPTLFTMGFKIDTEGSRSPDDLFAAYDRSDDRLFLPTSPSKSNTPSPHTPQNPQPSLRSSIPLPVPSTHQSPDSYIASFYYFFSPNTLTKSDLRDFLNGLHKELERIANAQQGKQNSYFKVIPDETGQKPPTIKFISEAQGYLINGRRSIATESNNNPAKKIKTEKIFILANMYNELCGKYELLENDKTFAIKDYFSQKRALCKDLYIHRDDWKNESWFAPPPTIILFLSSWGFPG